MRRPQIKVNGLVVDPQPIADGLYEIICDAGEENVLAFGMIPHWIIQHTEKLLREKVISENAKLLECTAAELAPFLDEQKIKDTIQPILHEITLGIYDAASRAGTLKL